MEDPFVMSPTVFHSAMSLWKGLTKQQPVAASLLPTREVLLATTEKPRFSSMSNQKPLVILPADAPHYMGYHGGYNHIWFRAHPLRPTILVHVGDLDWKGSPHKSGVDVLDALEGLERIERIFGKPRDITAPGLN